MAWVSTRVSRSTNCQSMAAWATIHEHRCTTPTPVVDAAKVRFATMILSQLTQRTKPDRTTQTGAVPVRERTWKVTVNTARAPSPKMQTRRWSTQRTAHVRTYTLKFPADGPQNIRFHTNQASKLAIKPKLNEYTDLVQQWSIGGYVSLTTRAEVKLLAHVG